MASIQIVTTPLDWTYLTITPTIPNKPYDNNMISPVRISLDLIYNKIATKNKHFPTKFGTITLKPKSPITLSLDLI